MWICLTPLSSLMKMCDNIQFPTECNCVTLYICVTSISSLMWMGDDVHLYDVIVLLNVVVHRHTIVRHQCDIIAQLCNIIVLLKRDV
jgi:hypothetical protein